MEHQDWTHIILKKQHTPPKQIQLNPVISKMNKLDNSEDIIKIEKISEEDKKTIINLRILKKMSQKVLAQKLNIKEDVIKSIENGTHPKNKQLTNKIKTFLNNYIVPT